MSKEIKVYPHWLFFKSGVLCDEADTEAGAVQIGRALVVVGASHLIRRGRAYVAQVRRTRPQCCVLPHQDRVAPWRWRWVTVHSAQCLRSWQTSAKITTCIFHMEHQFGRMSDVKNLEWSWIASEHWIELAEKFNQFNLILTSRMRARLCPYGT